MTAPFDLGPMPARQRMQTVDERVVCAPLDRVFDLVRAVERWPIHLRHYRAVHMQDRRGDGGGIVTMAASRPFGPLRWPVWWAAEMQVIPDGAHPAIRFRHVAGVTRGMEVEWSFAPRQASFAPATGAMATFVRIVHQWDGPHWPLVGGAAATYVIGPVFIHGIAMRTLRGLAAAAERGSSGHGPPAHDEQHTT